MKFQIKFLKICILFKLVITPVSSIAQDPFSGSALDFDGNDDYVMCGISPVLFSDDFESYEAGSQLAMQNPTDWTLYSGSTGGNEDPFVSNSFTHGGLNSIIIDSFNNLIKEFGPVTSGEYSISFWTYIPSGHSGNFRIFADSTNNIGMDCWIEAGGGATVYADTLPVSFIYQNDTWNIFEIKIDLDFDWATITYNDIPIHQWQWTMGTTGGGSPLELDAINFYAMTDSSEMYIDDFRILNSSSGFPNERLTVSFWMKTTNIGNFGTPLSYATSANPNSFVIYDYNNLEIYVNGQRSGPTGVSANDGQWHHIAVSWRSLGGQYRLYKDGQIVHQGSGLASGTVIPDSGILIFGQEQDILGGGFDPTQAFMGELDEVELWNDYFNEDFIRLKIHQTLQGNEPILVSYWQFNESSGDTAFDSKNNNHGILTNMDPADWMSSTAPVGGGFANLKIVSTSGIVDFPGTGLLMNFISKSGNDTFVVNKLNLSPSALEGLELSETFDSQYWIVNKYGTGSFTANLTFSVYEDITVDDESYPASLRLFQKASTSDGSWTNYRGSVKANASINTTEFDSISVFSQFLIGRQWFTNINTGLWGVYWGSVDWGDFDNDGDLDILLTGSNRSKIYRNDSGVFTDIAAVLPGVNSSSVAWGDYDNDGDLDILLTGQDGSYNISRIYRNDSGSFTDINAGLTGVYESSVAWGDYDNDGDLDIILSGASYNSSPISKIYRNDPGIFTDINAGLPGVNRSSVAWGDYDNDGDLDILLTGVGASINLVSKIYQNNIGVFTDIDAGLTHVGASSIAWGDYDNDGDLDILLTGQDASNKFISRIYRNDSGFFTDINAGLTGVAASSVAWGDYDNDGDLDILLTGINYSTLISIVYRNDTNNFTNINAGLAGVYWGAVAWGDYDNDEDLDILLTGQDPFSSTRIYRNNSIVSNSIPLSPSGLTANIYSDSVAFSWKRASDHETPQDGLSYNLLIENEEHDLLIKSPIADTANGYREITSIGNMNQALSWTYRQKFYPQLITPNYWGVQAIDNAFAGSRFATESINFPINYLSTINNTVMQLTDILSWEILFGDSIISYQVQIDEDSAFISCEVNDTLYVSIGGSGYYGIPLQDLSGKNSLIVGTKYYWRIKPNYTNNLPTTFTKPVPFFWFGYETEIDDYNETMIPEKFTLYQNYPNPFNPVTQIKYALPKNTQVKIELFDMIGQKIKVLLDEIKPAGNYTLIFEAANLASGIYLYRIQADNFVNTKKMLLMK